MSLWTLLVIGVLTFVIRAVFVLGPKLPAEEKLRPLLQGLPAAVMPALAAAAFLGQQTAAASSPKIIAVLATAAIAWRTRSIAAAMALGMLVFWGLRALGA